MYDLIVKNSNLLDPKAEEPLTCDIGIASGRIAALGTLSATDGQQVMDAAGCYVVPPLIDAHLHAAPLASLGVPVDAVCLPSGVGAAIDAGSAGSGTAAGLLPHLANMRVHVKAYLNVSATGLASLNGYPENINPRYFQERQIQQLFERFPDRLIGLKIRVGRETVQDMGLEPLIEARQLARKLGVGLMVHGTNPPFGLDEVLDLLDAGDVLTHFLHGHGHTILDADGRVLDAAVKARRRGVLFDVGDAGYHLSFKVAEAALRQGFKPDLIGTDLTVNGLYKRDKSFSLPYVMAKMIRLGLPLKDTIACCTQNPARLMQLEDTFGQIGTGRPASFTLIRLVDQENVFTDAHGEQLCGRQLIKVMATVLDGQLLYRDLLL
ncbi:MAG: amidohydrolase family protein [Clostridiales bacterium]|nr:amidohydrolase family protein [Clostridiales bacterium]